MTNEPEFTNWQDAWEFYANAELNTLRSQSAVELLDMVRTGKFGGYYVLWDAIAERATLQEAGWTLFAVLVSDADYLDRYHCAAALLKLLQSDAWEPVQLSAMPQERPANLARLREELERRIGPLE